jgi:hypothetical protein
LSASFIHLASLFVGRRGKLCLVSRVYRLGSMANHLFKENFVKLA